MARKSPDFHKARCTSPPFAVEQDDVVGVHHHFLMAMTRTSIASRTHLPHDPLRPAGPILVALGGSDVSGVLRAARYFASGSTTGMLAVSILAPLPTYSSAEGAFVLAPDLDAMRAENLLATLNAQILEGDAPVTSCQTEVIAGEPSHAIVEAAHTHHSPLIVMGIGRHKPLDRVLGLETAVRTVRRASCSVLAVHANIHVPFRDVVLATDFSPASVKAAETVIPLLTSGSVIHLVHVWEPSAVHDARLRTLDESYVASLPTKFRRLLEILKLPSGIAVKEEVLEGRIAERVLHYADTHDAGAERAGAPDGGERHRVTPARSEVQCADRAGPDLCGAGWLSSADHGHVRQ
jgi:nucleotide-binding universal stress UspA family protein